MLKRGYILIMLALVIVLAACDAEPAEVTRIVEVIGEAAEVVVTRIVEQTVTEEVEVEVTRVVEVEVEVPAEVEVAGRCAATSADEVEEILIGASAPLSKPGSVKIPAKRSSCLLEQHSWGSWLYSARRTAACCR